MRGMRLHFIFIVYNILIWHPPQVIYLFWVVLRGLLGFSKPGKP